MKWWLKLSALLCAAASMTALANVQLFNEQTQKALQGLNGSLTKGLTQPAAPTASAREVGAYTPSREVSEQVRTDVIARTAGLAEASGADAATVSALKQGLQQADVVGQTWRTLSQMGFARDSLTTATAYWLLVNWDILHDTQTQGASAEAVVQQVREHYGQNGKLAGMTDADVQYGAEALLWLALLQYQVYQDAVQSGNAASIDAARADARQALRMIGFEADAFVLTDQGFASR